MKTRFRATILPLVACSALALMGACSDVTAPQPSAAASQAGLAPSARRDFGGFFGAESAPIDSLAGIVTGVPKTFGKTLPRP